MSVEPSIRDHQTWLGYVQPTGLVVSPPALVAASCSLPLDAAARQAVLRTLAPGGRILDLPAFFSTLLEWEPRDLVPAEALADLQVPLPEHGDILAPTWAVPKPDGEPGWQILVVKAPDEPADYGFVADGKRPHWLDLVPPEDTAGWRASPQARFERLLREREIPVGLLVNDTDVRLVYAPRGESSGYLTFRVADMLTVAGRPIFGALVMLLSAERLFTVPPNKRLPAVLRESRKYQAQVSTALAEQVLGALDDLLRGFEMADADRNGALLRQVVDADPQHVYGGLITVLLRLVFLLYAEERGLMSGDPAYARHYSVAGLFEKLREDAGRHPDTMDQRYGAWPRLLSLFRFVWRGGGDERLHLPGRRGALFDPGIYAFLEGRAHRQADLGEQMDVPRVPDGVVWRVLEKLLLLDGERLSYRALDVEQIGSVYEAMMGFELRRAYAPSVALRPKRIVVSLEGLLQATGAGRAKILKEEAQVEVTGKALDALKAAKTHPELAAALGKKVVDGRILTEGSLYLQPGEERRRSGSHYTPRSLTQPIVKTTLRPILEQLGERPRPAQILDLKVCDPAMGSGAFLVEACRQLADALVESWSVHRATPEIPPDEDPVLFARRLVAQRCLYGVDKNPFAVNLAKLSLWLVTLAKDHPFTFLDHALKHGDSLVGLTKRQIGRFDWSQDDPETLPILAAIEAATAKARVHRDEISRASDDDDAAKRRAWRDAEDDLDEPRAIGDLCIAAFFSSDNARKREERREELRVLARSGDNVQIAHERAKLPVVPFHWEIEFPEVFERKQAGFDAMVGNPPFAGKNTIAASCAPGFGDWLKELHEESHGNADLVAHFFRRAFGLLRKGGTFGLIATNTIAQGDTRGSGLRWIRHHGGWIYDATRRYKWPGLAAVVVSVVHVSREREVRPVRLDGEPVDKITAFLFPRGPDDDPARLPENAGKSFIGSYVLGMGFTFDDDNPDATPIAEMHRLIAKDPRNAERIFPYLGGEEVNDSPTHQHRRYVINFGEMSEDEARQWPELMEIVERKVKPERDKLADNPDGRKRKANWWLWGRYTPALFRAIEEWERVLVATRHQHHLAIAAVGSQCTFAESLVVVVLAEAGFAVLQSRVHEVWARYFGSSMKDDLRYNPSDCFETFPFPRDWAQTGLLPAAASAYHDHRAAWMAARGEGLTKTYNQFHDPVERDPGILELRRLHDAMDRAVLDAYGWNDLRPECAFLLDWDEAAEEDEEGRTQSRRKKPWRYHWPDEMRDEVLARLLALNEKRAAEGRSLAGPKEPPLSARDTSMGRVGAKKGHRSGRLGSDGGIS
jgi:hypothetical protein